MGMVLCGKIAVVCPQKGPFFITPFLSVTPNNANRQRERKRVRDRKMEIQRGRRDVEKETRAET